MHKKDDYILQNIANHLIINCSFSKNIGLLYGTMGIIIFFYHYARYSKNRVYEEFNENFFGKMIIMPNGETYSNINHNSLGNAFDDILSINKLVYKEMRHGKAWFKVRDEIPCKNCCNKSLCPSPSNYEIVTNRVNLCNIKK